MAAREHLTHPWLVWRNELGGLTFRFHGAGGGGVSYAKWLPTHPEFDVDAEAARLAWAGSYIAVPEVLGLGHAEAGAWLWTRGLPGRTAVDPRYQADPVAAARAIGVGLRTMHDRLPVADCPFTWSVADRLRWVSVEGHAPLLADAPPIDRLVVCHGDACSPNTLLDNDARYVGHVDLGMLGVADRWADLAVATYSLGWNFPGSLEAELLDAYGIDPDLDRTTYYRRLWDAS